MNFNEWIEIQNKGYKSLSGFHILDSKKENMKEGWDACKNEVFKILEKYDIPLNVIDEIEKL